MAEVAEACFRRAISLHPRTHAKAHNNLGQLLHVRGDLAAAAAAYASAVEVAPLYAVAWHNLGLVRVRLGGAAAGGGGGERGVGRSSAVDSGSGSGSGSSSGGDAAACFRRALRAAEATGASSSETAAEAVALGEALLNKGFVAWRRSAPQRNRNTPRGVQPRTRAPPPQEPRAQQGASGMASGEEVGEASAAAEAAKQQVAEAAALFKELLEGARYADLARTPEGQATLRRARELAGNARGVLSGMGAS